MFMLVQRVNAEFFNFVQYIKVLNAYLLGQRVNAEFFILFSISIQT